MLTHHAIQNSAGAAHYFSAQDDYYTKDGAGVWMGKGAERLGLSGDVDPAQFRTILDGKLPDGRSIQATYGAAKGRKRHGWDFTFSAPKSVSMQALIGGDTRIVEAHQKAVTEALGLLETSAVARKKVSGVSHRETTGNLVAAAFQHELSRAKDPQLHTHVVVMNMTHRRDGEWRALSNEELFKRTKLVGAAYRATLARELQIAGYEIRRTDGEGGFELAHISRTQIEAFSRRGQDIEEALKQRGKSREQASTLEKQVITLATRPVKDRLRPDDKHLLMEHWKQRSAAEGIGYDAPGRSSTDQKRHDHARESLDFVIAHLTERQSVMLDSMLMTTAMQHAVGRATRAELRTELNRRIGEGSVIQEQPLYRTAVARDSTPPKTRFHFEAAMVQEERVPYGQAILKVTNAIAEGALVKAEPRYTTAEAWQMERAILRLEQDGRYRLPPIMAAAPAEHALARTDLNRGQMDAARMLLTTSNRVTGIQGSAGVGKSHMLKSATAIAERNGYRVVLLAPYANQVERLQEDGLKASTLAAFLVSKDKHVDNHTVIVIDEAGLVPSRQMQAALTSAERHGARVILSGDIQQLKAVEAGRPFAQLQAGGMATAIINEIQRQKTADLKPAVELAAKGKAEESLKHIEAHVREVPEQTARWEEIAQRYATLSEAERAQTLVVSGTNEARRELNALIRQKLGVDGQGLEFETLARKDLTQAERRYAHSYQVGDVVQPEKDYMKTDLKRGDLYRVSEIEARNRVVLTGAGGRKHEIDPRVHAQLSVYESTRTELAAGDCARITRNDPALDVSNGDRVRVLTVGQDRVSVENEKGRRIDLDGRAPLHLEHAYATTVHSAQGLTIDRMLVDIDTRSLTTGKDLYYVAISRARYEAQIYTNSRPELPIAISRENIKTAALDVQRQAPGPSAYRAA
jgi:conjugative relaxase-like TrwC/TraI family protein